MAQLFFHCSNDDGIWFDRRLGPVSDLTEAMREAKSVVRSLVEYKSPIVFDQEIEVGVRVGRIGVSSLRFDLGVFGKGEDRLYASGEIVWVYTDQRTHEAVRVSDALRARIASVDAVD